MLRTHACCLILFGGAGVATTAVQGQAAPRTPARPQVTVSRAAPNEGRVLSEYFDENTGRAVVVKGGTSQDSALAWLTKVTRTDGVGWEEALSATVAASAPAGLAAATGVWGDAEILVSWGPPPRRDPPSGIMVASMKDLRTGASLAATGEVKAELTNEWLAAVAAAKTEADLHLLVQSHQAKGLLSVTTYIEGGFKVTTWWSTSRP